MKTSFQLLLGLATAALAGAADKPRVFITESGAFQLSGNTSLGDAQQNIQVQDGTSPHNIEVIKHFMRQCPQVLVTANRTKADYLVRLDRDEISPLSPFVRGNKVAVFDRTDDLIHSDSTRKLSNAVKSACAAILRRAVQPSR